MNILAVDTAGKTLGVALLHRNKSALPEKKEETA